MKGNLFALSKLFLYFLTAGVFTAGCEYNATDEEVFVGVSAEAKGSEEVPPVSTLATATVTGQFNRRTKELTYTLNYLNLKDSAVGAHFHGPASPGQNAPVLINIFTNTRPAAGTVSNTVTLADSVVQHFMNGKMYLNVHSKVHRGGEVRGQVVMR